MIYLVYYTLSCLLQDGINETRDIVSPCLSSPGYMKLGVEYVAVEMLVV